MVSAPAVTALAVPAKRSLDAIKASLAKGKERESMKETEAVKDQILDLEAEMKMFGSREHAALSQVKALNLELEDATGTLAELRQNRDILEDAVALITDCEAIVEDVKKKLAKSKSDLDSLAQEKASMSLRISTLRDQLSSTLAQKDLALHRKQLEKPEAGNQKPLQTNISRKLTACRPDIQRIFTEVGRCNVKLTAYPNDKDARTYFIEDLAAQIRVYRAEPEFHGINSAEGDILYLARGTLQTQAKQFGTWYIDAFSPEKRPKDFNTWSEYAADVKRQMSKYFSRGSEPAKPAAPQFGVVKAADPLPAPRVEPPVIQPVVQVKPAAPVQKKEVPKPVSKPVSVSPEFRKAIEASGLLKITQGMRVALVAGLPDKGGLTPFLEDMLCLKRLAWHDGRRNDDLIVSIKASGIDMLLAVPKWHAGFKFYTDFAKEKGIQSVILGEHNKFKVVQQIAKHFGINLDIPADA